MIADLPLLRREDHNHSGRIEQQDLYLAHIDYMKGLIGRQELETVYQAWYTGRVFTQRYLPIHLRDWVPTVQAAQERRVRRTHFIPLRP